MRKVFPIARVVVSNFDEVIIFLSIHFPVLHRGISKRINRPNHWHFSFPLHLLFLSISIWLQFCNSISLLWNYFCGICPAIVCFNLYYDVFYLHLSTVLGLVWSVSFQFCDCHAQVFNPFDLVSSFFNLT